jgi:hypothetical protein
MALTAIPKQPIEAQVEPLYIQELCYFYDRWFNNTTELHKSNDQANYDENCRRGEKNINMIDRTGL